MVLKAGVFYQEVTKKTHFNFVKARQRKLLYHGQRLRIKNESRHFEGFLKIDFKELFFKRFHIYNSK